MSESPTTATLKSPKLQQSSLQPLQVDGNLAHNWKNWIQHFNIYMRASGLENEEDKRKVAIFLHFIGGEALDIFNSFNLDMDTCSYDDVITKFKSHCMPKKNLTVERQLLQFNLGHKVKVERHNLI
ncbi:hypothetical protein QE152_g26162 [Popillia japonica]|uniref:Retrotransposon gag domain-containing protein n=1 Tax=Popillia japonica TaxID=7064 RepID=A0AAW1JY77_POPJA